MYKLIIREGLSTREEIYKTVKEVFTKYGKIPKQRCGWSGFKGNTEYVLIKI